MTAVQDNNEPTTRLFQVTLLRWGTPLMVAAPDLNAATKLAAANWRLAPRGILVVDATEQFERVSEALRAHTDAIRFAGVCGVVDYDDDEGWILIDADIIDRPDRACWIGR